jgi:hypothetical protein
VVATRTVAASTQVPAPTQQVAGAATTPTQPAGVAGLPDAGRGTGGGDRHGAQGWLLLAGALGTGLALAVGARQLRRHQG